MLESADPRTDLRRLGDFADYLALTGLSYREGEGEILVVPAEVWGHATELYLALEDDILQMQLTLPVEVGERRAADLALLICDINSGLQLPGFSLEDERGVVCYRISAPVPRRGLDSELFELLLATVSATAEEHWHELSRLASSAHGPHDSPAGMADDLRRPAPLHRFDAISFERPTRPREND
ncbi:MAG: YbjN domain-containing protein [Acidobacteriota bacterium]